jgi:hypothetical protein
MQKLNRQQFTRPLRLQLCSPLAPIPGLLLDRLGNRNALALREVLADLAFGVLGDGLGLTVGCLFTEIGRTGEPLRGCRCTCTP